VRIAMLGRIPCLLRGLRHGLLLPGGHEAGIPRPCMMPSAPPLYSRTRLA
jgi:hypothetical protein